MATGINEEDLMSILRQDHPAKYRRVVSMTDIFMRMGPDDTEIDIDGLWINVETLKIMEITAAAIPFNDNGKQGVFVPDFDLELVPLPGRAYFTT